MWNLQSIHSSRSIGSILPQCPIFTRVRALHAARLQGSNASEERASGQICRHRSDRKTPDRLDVGHCLSSREVARRRPDFHLRCNVNRLSTFFGQVHQMTPARKLWHALKPTDR